MKNPTTEPHLWGSVAGTLPNKNIVAQFLLFFKYSHRRKCKKIYFFLFPILLAHAGALLCLLEEIAQKGKKAFHRIVACHVAVTLENEAARAARRADG